MHKTEYDYEIKICFIIIFFYFFIALPLSSDWLFLLWVLLFFRNVSETLDSSVRVRINSRRFRDGEKYCRRNRRDIIFLFFFFRALAPRITPQVVEKPQLF